MKNECIADKPRYQYHVLTWGGFYNKEYKDIHGFEEGDYVFESEKEREDFIKNRELVADKLNARYLMISCSEGYCCNIRTTLHRIVRHKGVDYYTTRDMGINYPFKVAKSFLENKWYPGFNDYPLGEDFDYSKVSVIKEWITGADQETSC